MKILSDDSTAAMPEEAHRKTWTEGALGMILPPSNHARVAPTKTKRGVLEVSQRRRRREEDEEDADADREACPFEEDDRAAGCCRGLFFALSPVAPPERFAGFARELDDVRAQYPLDVGGGARRTRTIFIWWYFDTGASAGRLPAILNGNSLLLDLAEEGSNYMEGSPRYIRIERMQS